MKPFIFIPADLSVIHARRLVPMSSQRVSKRIAIIGGGSAGVVAARKLCEAGHLPTIFEAGAGFGGIWSPTPLNTAVYKNLRTNLPTCVMQSHGLKFDCDTPSYVDAPALGKYIV